MNKLAASTPFTVPSRTTGTANATAGLPVVASR